MKFWAAILLLRLALSAFGQDSVRTLAGQALVTGTQDGPAREARFNDPGALAIDNIGNIFVADTRNNQIRKLSLDGSVTAIATSGPAFDTPSGLAWSSQGLVVSDTGNHTIRRINLDGTTTIVAGSFRQAGFEDGVSSTARFDSPLGLAVSTNGIIYVADCGNHTIRAISPDGVVTTFAGASGSWGTNDGYAAASRFNGPVGLTFDSRGNLFVSDSNNHTIRKITAAGDVITFAGVPLESGFVNSLRSAAKFFQPAGLAFDTHGDLYVADSMNHAIRKISSEGVVSVAAGLSETFGAEDGDNGHARLYNPYSVAFLSSGELIVSDAYNQTIRNAVPPAELTISIDGLLSVSWNSVIGKQYQLQIASPSLEIWQNVAAPATAVQRISTCNLPLGDLGVFRVITKIQSDP